MRILLTLFALLTFSNILSQNSFGEFLDEMNKKSRYFKKTYNIDSTNFSLLVIDSSKNILLEFDYKINNPILNLENDYFDMDFAKGIRNSINSLDYFEGKNSTKEINSKNEIVDTYFLRSKYEFKNFKIDTINPLLKDVIQELGFPYCNEFLNINVDCRCIYLNINSINNITKNKLDTRPYGHAVIQNNLKLFSCGGNLSKRELKIINSNGQLYSIQEEFDLNEKPKFSYGFYGTNDSRFDIIAIDSREFFITYVNKDIRIYDLHSEKLIRQINSTRKDPYIYEAISTNNQIIAFIPKPVRIGGYDLKTHFGFKGNHIDFSRIKDYDETMKELLIYDLKNDDLYSSFFRVDKIEKIQNIEGLKIIFEDGKIENVKQTFELKK